MVTLLRRHYLPLTLSLALILAAVGASVVLAAPTVETSFGSAGFVSPSVFPQNKKGQAARDVALQPDGKIIVPMTVARSWGRRDRRPVIRLNADGTRDKKYGRAGVGWVRAAGAPFVTLTGASIMPDGGALIRGEYAYRDKYSYDGFFIAKLNANGVQDKSFGNRGARRFSYAIEGHDMMSASAFPAGDGTVIVASELHNLRTDRDTIRFTRITAGGSTGRLSKSVRTKAVPIKVSAPFPGDRGVAVSGDSLYLAVSSSRCKIRRYTLSPSMQLDRTFGKSGEVIAKGGCSGITDTATGGLVVHGSISPENLGPSALLQRFNSDGSVDASFGKGGAAQLDAMDGALRAAALSDGSVLASGDCGYPVDLNGCLALVDSAGAPVAGFGKSGVLDLGRYSGGAELSATRGMAVALIRDEDSKSFVQTRILKLTN